MDGTGRDSVSNRVVRPRDGGPFDLGLLQPGSIRQGAYMAVEVSRKNRQSPVIWKSFFFDVLSLGASEGEQMSGDQRGKPCWERLW